MVIPTQTPMEPKVHSILAEKYRPTQFSQIVLDPYNQLILTKLIELSSSSAETVSMPHLLFYGPPGTGKTTTIINLVQAYQRREQPDGKIRPELVIHLNASDERGIEVIRSQIFQFVNSKTLFHKGTKFVILDEVDYMTHSAQQALKYLMQSVTVLSPVCFCLICNYISRIDARLQTEFIQIRFNQLPVEDILRLLERVVQQENLVGCNVRQIQQLYRSDIRSMLNHLQSQNPTHLYLDASTWESCLKHIGDVPSTFGLKHIGDVPSTVGLSSNQHIAIIMKQMQREHGLDMRYLVQELLSFLVRNHRVQRSQLGPFLDFVHKVLHMDTTGDMAIYEGFVFSKLSAVFQAQS